jgi:hypothetical protein
MRSHEARAEWIPGEARAEIDEAERHNARVI